MPKRPTPKQSAASAKNLIKARAARRGHSLSSAKRKLSPSEMHGSGTGLTAVYRYLPVNVAKRQRR